MKSLFVCTLLLFLFACSGVEKKETVIIEKIPAEIPEPDLFDYDTLKGQYKGDFAGSDIRIILNYVSSSKAIGYNIHKGLQRNLNGDVDRNGDTIFMTLSEPGDHEFDGVFKLTFIGIDKEPSGGWEPLNSEQLTNKEFQLKKVERKKIDDNKFSIERMVRWEPLYDTVGTYYFEEDGLCRFEYYPSDLNENARDQKVEITGNWNIQDNSVIIEWQPNKIFGSKLQLKLVENEYGEHYLVGDGRELHMLYY